ncbi:MAG TPA: hypothetical protein VM124_02615 [Candidatus Limnocylindrales bacterium]|nr:hypothetical protein [Candidatus Limnocylindrales bacterium]
MFQKLLGGIVGQRTEQRQADLYRNLIRHEARIGGNVFGAIPKGHRREFFCLDEHTWVWHEEWRDNKGQQQIRTTRYDVRPDGILKSQGGHYQRVTDSEAQRLRKAAYLYIQRVNSEMYNGLIAL